jgi:hypothetical protein
MAANKRFRKLKPAAKVTQAEFSRALTHIRSRVAGNLLHPGRHVADKPHARLGKAEWLDAVSAYTALRHSIEAARKTKRTKSGPKSIKRR